MGKHAGRSGRPWERLKAQVRARETHCWQCGQPIDWTIPYRDPDTGAVNADAGTVEHINPRSTHPHLAEDPANLGASHRRCNLQAGTSGTIERGTPSRQW